VQNKWRLSVKVRYPQKRNDSPEIDFLDYSEDGGGNLLRNIGN